MISNRNCIFVFFVTIILFLLFATHLPISVLLGDVCVYLDEVEQDLDSVFDKGMALTLQSCLEGTSLMDALNLTSSFQFRDQILFPDLPDLDNSFAFDELASFSNDVNALTLSTFGYDPADLNTMLNELATNLVLIDTAVTPYTRDNIKDVIPVSVKGGERRDQRNSCFI